MDPFSALLGGFGSGAASAGIGVLANAVGLGNQRQPTQYVDPNAAWINMAGPLLAGGNTAQSAAMTREGIAGGLYGGALSTMYGADTSSQLNNILTQLTKEASGAALQGTVAGQQAGLAMQLPYQGKLGELGTELAPVQTLQDFSKQFGASLGAMSQTGLASTAELGKTGILAETELRKQGVGGTLELGKENVASQTALGGKTLDTSAALQNTTLTGEQALLQPTSTALAQAGAQTLAGQNQLASDIAKNNLSILKGQEDTRNALIRQQGDIAGQLALRRWGAQQAAGGHARFA